MQINDGRVVSNFIMQALKGEDITLYGDGGQSRSFCYVGDLVEGILRFMDLPDCDDGVPGFPGPMNLGNPNECTIRQLAEMVIELIGSTSKIVFQALPADDPRQRQPDISCARGLLGWEPTVQLQEGLGYTVSYFEGLLP